MAKNASAGDPQSLESAQVEQSDLFACDITTWPVKDDLASMEIPLFSLAKQKDLNTREYRRGNKTVSIRPGADGAATVFDKDLLLYVASQIVEARNQGLPTSRTVRVDSMDFLVGTSRGDGRASFERILDMLRRLAGTRIETNIPTGGVMQIEGFSMIDSYKIIAEKRRQVPTLDERTHKVVQKDVQRVLQFTVTISEWLYNGLVNFEVLTLDRGYFKLSKSIERRLYEIARKHCGDQPIWKENIDGLIQKLGSTRERFKLRDDIREVIEADTLPEYRIALDANASPDMVVFYTRNPAKLHKELVRAGTFKWFETLERADNVEKWRAKRNKRRESLLQAGPAIADV